MVNVLKSLVVITGALLFNAVGLVGHAGANVSHGAHQTADSTQTLTCANVCMSLPNNRPDDDERDFNKNKDDDYEQPSFVSAVTVLDYSHEHTAKAVKAASYDPPPGIANYILNTVFRV